jgi:hypothetical protein
VTYDYTFTLPGHLIYDGIHVIHIGLGLDAKEPIEKSRFPQGLEVLGRDPHLGRHVQKFPIVINVQIQTLRDPAGNLPNTTTQKT